MSSRILAGRYELLEKIGDGGMAVVYKARCRLLNRFVAIKILKPEFTKDHKFIDSFRRESQAAASLSHPNIVNVYDVGKEGNIYYIVMELIEGQVLSDIIKNEGPMDYKRAIDITKQIALALSFAHKNHIIHRDVKPHNILITSDGVAKITDFGIAKAVNTGTIVGNTGTIIGSVHYFSPEQARGGYVDEKSDIYSLGIVLYELLTGKVPFDAENPVAVALMHMNEPIVPPSQIVLGIPPKIEEIVLKATSKYQVNRYKSANEMYDALNAPDIDMFRGSAVSSGTRTNLEATRVMTAINRHGEADMGEYREEPAEEMRNNGKKANKSKKRVKINKIKVAAIILALLCAIPASQLILNAIENMGAAKDVTVPDLQGMTVEEATDELAKLDLKLEVGDKVASAEFDEGEIVSQDPIADMTVKAGYTVKVNISKGVVEGLVPNLVNRTVTDAIFVLESYGYKAGLVTQENSDMPKDIVIRQTPEAGTEASPGTTINIVVSLGKAVEQVSMPNLMGMGIDAATAELEKYGLKIQTIGREMSQAYAKNTVMWQQYQPGTMVDKNTAVNLKISTGDEPAGSRSVPLTLDFSAAHNEVFYLTVVISDESGVRTVINREQRIKSEGSEILSLSGEGVGTVKVIYDNDVVMERNVDFNTGVIS